MVCRSALGFLGPENKRRMQQQGRFSQFKGLEAFRLMVEGVMHP
jgi:hypothetical protein